MELSRRQMVLLSRGLLGVFVFTVTSWYFLSPFGVRSHPQFQIDMENMISSLPIKEEHEGEKVLENFTKWQLILGEGDEVQVVFPHQRVSIGNLSLPVSAVLEWREEYKTEILESEEGKLLVTSHRPWYGNLGLYNHFSAKVMPDGKTVRFLPNFMFGAKQEVLDQLYGGPEAVPMIGIMASTPGRDRVLVQTFMNLVILSVILLLWANNPQKKTEKED